MRDWDNIVKEVYGRWQTEYCYFVECGVIFGKFFIWNTSPRHAAKISMEGKRGEFSLPAGVIMEIHWVNEGNVKEFVEKLIVKD